MAGAFGLPPLFIMKSVHISNGNSKIGKTMNVSLTPVKSCIKDAPCAKQCYACNPYRRFKQVRKNWDENYDLAVNDLVAFFTGIHKELAKKKPEYFRWHVSGDIPSTEYLIAVVSTARMFPDTQFELFTKRYDLLKIVDRRRMPKNLHIVASVWPGLKIPAKVMRRFPKGFYRNPKMPDPRIPEDAFTCKGDCAPCRRCWGMKKEESVVFEHH